MSVDNAIYRHDGFVRAERTGLRALLAYLELDVKPPSYAYLNSIARQACARIPYDGVSRLVLYPNGETPPLDEFVANLEAGFGGTCTSTNRYLCALLGMLGFPARLVGVEPNHVGIITHTPDLGPEPLYVDCGAQAPFFAAVRFQTDPHNVSKFGCEEIHIRAHESKPGWYRNMKYLQGVRTQSGWAFDAASASLTDRDLDVLSCANMSTPVFSATLRFQWWDLDHERNLRLVGNRFTISWLDRRTETRTLKDVAAVEQVFADEFARPSVPVRQAVERLASRGIEIFDA